MATKLQYDVFRAQYDEEISRRRDHRETAKVFLGVCTFLIGGLILKLKYFIQGAPPFAVAVLLAGSLALLAACALLLLAIGVRRHETLFCPCELIEKMGDTRPTDEDFLDARLVDIAVACDRNGRQNQHRARLIAIASVVLLCGGVLAVVGAVLSSIL